MKLYHGTNHIVVRHPEVRISGYNKDFGFGFYCTQYERQAKRWALTKRGAHIVCVYDYTPNVQLKVKIFPEMTDEWLDFVAACRHGCHIHLMLWKVPWQMMIHIRYCSVRIVHSVHCLTNHTMNYEQ